MPTVSGLVELGHRKIIPVIRQLPPQLVAVKAGIAVPEAYASNPGPEYGLEEHALTGDGYHRSVHSCAQQALSKQPESPAVSPAIPSIQTIIITASADTSTSISVSVVSYTPASPTPARSTSTAASPQRPVRSSASPTALTQTHSPTTNSSQSTGSFTSSSSSPQPETTTTTSSDAPSIVNPPPRNPQSKTSMNDKLIATIGVPIGCILLAALGFCLLHRRKKRQSQAQQNAQHEEKIRNWYTVPSRRGPHELDTQLISRPYMKPELSSDEARRDVVEVEADDVVWEIRSTRASVVHEPRNSRSTVVQEWIKNQPRTWI
ncbi:MAG: hypothetical protein Q9169_006162 [Polycauliona sp. 2 TL-2023]